MYIETEFYPNERHLRFIDYVSSDSFPWFYQQSTSDKYMFFSHVFMKRDFTTLDSVGIVNSNMYEECFDIFKTFCEQNDVSFSKIYRAAVNLTTHTPSEMVDIHTDHQIEHKVFLLYLNEFTNGETFIYDNDHKLIKTIVPNKNKGVIFSGEPHSHAFCSPFERRLVIVIAFN